MPIPGPASSVNNSREGTNHLSGLFNIHMPKGKIFLSPIKPSQLYQYENKIIARVGGLVKIQKVWPTKVDYYFLEDATSIIESGKSAGFYALVAFIPEAVEELDKYMPIKQQGIEYAARFLAKKPSGVFETSFPNRLVTAKTIFLHVDKTIEEEPLAYVAQKRISIV